MNTNLSLKRWLQRCLHTVVLLSLLFSPLQSVSAYTPPPAPPEPVEPDVLSTGLYRTTITLRSPADWTRLEKLGVVVLERTADQQNDADFIPARSASFRESAVILADGDQLEALARLRFEPRGTDELGALMVAHARTKPWLVAGLRAMLERGSPGLADQSSGMRESIRESWKSAFSPELKAGLAALTSVDADADGLTNTEELWWCTDPLNPNSDGDAQGYTDGQEVAALLDVTLPRNVRWGYGPPFRAWPPFVDTIAPGETPSCLLDADHDSIPDLAETNVVGSRVPSESTDNDKFDDGQELFGTTYCTPSDTDKCGYGLLPRNVDYEDDFITENMPNWVLPPGDNLFVAAFPIPEVYVEPGSWTVERVTTITHIEGQMTKKTHSYETAVTRGESTSIANTVTWNEWEEVAESVERPLTGITFSVTSVTACQPAGSLGCRIWGGTQVVGGIAVAAGAAILCGTATAASLGIGAVPCIGIVAGAGAVGGALVGEGWSDLTSPEKSPDSIQNNYFNTSNYNNYSYNPDYFDFSQQNYAYITLNQQLNSQGIVNSLDGVQYAINHQGALIAQGLQDVSYAISQPRFTETHTSGKSWGGAQTTTHEVYEEHTISEGQAFTTGQNWETAWAVDSSRAAELTFRYTVKNTGTEFAREVSNLAFNIYLGDVITPTISYPAWEQFPAGKLENLFPVGPNTPPGVGSAYTFASNPIPLSLETMKRIDLGERLTVKVEKFNYGADEAFYVNAVTGGVTVFIEDGVEDGDESVDMYVIPTWGVESIQDVLTRYFPADYDIDGTLNGLWTPEFDGINPPEWNEHFLSDIAWWNVYLTQPDVGNTPLKDLPAQDGSGLLFRFNRDSDRDGYNDQAEFRYYCALLPDDPKRRPLGESGPDYCADGHRRPGIHPQPEVLAGYVAVREGDLVTVTLAVENTGTFDAYGIDAVMYSPDDTTTIGNNTVGGNGRVRPGNHVAVGSLIKPPDLASWGSSTSKPYAGGNYSGDIDRTFTFTATIPGMVSQGDTAMAWSNGTGVTGTLELGSDYHAPLPLDITGSLQVGFNTGTIAAGAGFTVEALMPRDTFTYTVNSDPFTPPVIVVSYSDPQGSHRFVTPVEVAGLDASLTPHVGQMLKGLKLDIVATGQISDTAANTTNLVVNNPHPATIQDGQLHLNFVSDGTLVLEQSYTLDIPAGPTVFPAEWSVSEFSNDYIPDGDNILIAFWTDSENNIIDSAARPFNTFATDPEPASDMREEDDAWDFGTAAQGTLLRRTIAIGSVGYTELLAYIGAAPGLTIPGLSNRRVPPGDVALYNLILDTTELPEGLFEQDLPLRTSDVEQPDRTITIQGNVTPGLDESPSDATIRPLDRAVEGVGDHSQGEWVEFTHIWGPVPEILHPVKVYSQDDSTLHGVGKYATSFGPRTVAFDMFGSGQDGDLLIGTGQTVYTDDTRAALNATANSGQKNLTVANTSGFAVGQEVLIIQMQGTDAGNHEFGIIANVSGGTLTLEDNLTHTYHIGGNSKAQALRVPHYRDVTVQTGGILTARAWDGSVGGVIAFRSNGNTIISGTVSANGLGFRPGNSDTQGESYTGVGANSHASQGANGGGGGGCRGDNNENAGGGGGYGTAGSNGTSPFPGWGVGGGTYGASDLTQIHLGSGGGGGHLAVGANGGGIILIFSANMEVTGSINSRGNDATNRDGGGSGRGGGGSGGAILVRSQNANLGENIISATGGSGGINVGGSGGSGGSGGVGRIRVEYCDILSGFTNPPASTEKLDCYDTKIRLLRLPAISYEDVTLSLRFSQPGVPSEPLAFSVDVGNDGSIDWSYADTTSFPATISSPNLAAAFNAYLAGRTGEVDVPIRIVTSPSLDTTVYDFSATPLTQPDMTLAAGSISFGNGLLSMGSRKRLSGLRLSPTGPFNPFPGSVDSSPTEGDVISVTATISNTGQADAGPLTVAFFATPPAGFGEIYIGATFVPAVVAGDPADATIQWNTLGFAGDVPVRVVVDPFNRLAETDEENNEATTSLTILTRPDLSVPAIELSDPEPVAGQPVAVTLTISNAGQTDAGASILALYDGNPASGGTLVDEKAPAVPGTGETTVAFTWTPSAPGPHRLFAISDRDNAVNEFDEGNNQTWRDVYVGFAGPLLLDSGGDTDPVYTPVLGYGAVDASVDDALEGCGSKSYETFRRDPSNRVIYRFDHLLPGHFYHLDVTLYNCPTQPPRRETVLVDDIAVAGPVNLRDDGEVHRLSTLLDPALYANHTISVTIQSQGSGAVVSEVNLYDIDYRYADAGGTDDLSYTSERGDGYLDETSTSQTDYGTLPYQSYREDQADQDLHYQFDGLDPAKRYLAHLTFYQDSPFTASQQAFIDNVDTGLTLEVGPGQILTPTIQVPLGAYQSDGRIVVRVVRTTVGAFINEIALEELTLGTGDETQHIDLHSGWNWISFALEPKIERDTACTGVTPTSAFSSFTGSVFIIGVPPRPVAHLAPAGSLVEAYSPRGDKVGCQAVSTAGIYPFMRVYGEEGATPGMRAGEPIIFKVNGVAAAVTSGSPIWQNDKDTHNVGLSASGRPPVEKVLATVSDVLEKLLCEVGTYLPLPANPVFNSCHTMQPSLGYLLRASGDARLTVEGDRVPADTPLDLHQGWNWIGYLPPCGLSVETALASIDGKFNLLHGDPGTYQPPPGNPANTLHQMNPGHGYIIRMTESVTLNYPGGACGGANVQTSEVSENPDDSACTAIPTPYFTIFHGTAKLGNHPYPVGTSIEALSPRGEVVGCAQVGEDGTYPFLRVYGADDNIHGMQADEPVTFRVNSRLVSINKPPRWQNDRDIHRLDLRIEPEWRFLPLIAR